MFSTLRPIFGSLLIGALLISCSPADRSNQTVSVDEIRQANAMLDAFGRQELLRSPELATRLGLSSQTAGYSYIDKLDDRSQAGFERARLERIEMFEKLSRIDPAGMPADTRLTLSITKATLESLVELSGFGHGQLSLGFSRPYAADQLSGAYLDLPDLLINRQIIRNREEALAYLTRLSLVADAIDDDARRLRADAHAGVIPPDIILTRMIEICRDFNQSDVTAHPLLSAFESLSLVATDMSDAERQAIMERIKTTLQNDILPAYMRFEKTLEDLLQKAPETPGIWAIKHGDTYYKSALEFYTGQSLDPDQLHTEGLQIVADLTRELNLALQEAGFADGTIKARLDEINALPEQIFDNTPEGRRALMDSFSIYKAAITQRLTRLVPSVPQTRLIVDQVPDFLKANAPGGYYASAPADGSSPAIFYINLRDTAEWPAYSLPTLYFHEAIPGHHLESALLSEQGRLPLVRQLIWLPVYGEGWALYAEDLANELGVYKDDPLGKVGYLQSLLFRAARLVADTGLHQKRWSRQQAIDYLVETTGQSESAMETEVDRYTVWPGQAVSYMVGRQFIWSLRQRAQIKLKQRFDLAKFHGTLLSNGPRPLSQLETDIDTWIASQLTD